MGDERRLARGRDISDNFGIRLSHELVPAESPAMLSVPLGKRVKKLMQDLHSLV